MTVGELLHRALGLRRRLLGFASLHAANAALAMSTSLVQLVVFGHVLPRPVYTAAVAVTAMGLYLQPFSQACARANYVALRARVLGANDERAPPEVTMLLYASLSLSVAACVAFGLFVVGTLPSDNLGLWLLLVGAALNNLWYYDLQFALWAQDFTVRFERLSFIRRILTVACLIPLAVTGSLASFTLPAILISLGFSIWLVRVAPEPLMLRPANLRRLSRAGAAAQCKRFGSAFLSTLSELTVFSAPYAVVVRAYGLGAGLVALDSVMKLTRIGLAVTRNIAEIALPRQSRAQAEGDNRRSLRLFGLTLTAALGLNTVFALVLLFGGDLVFHLMLGPNNVLPAGAGLPTAAIQIVATVYGAASFFLALTGHDREIVKLTGAAAVGMAGFAAFVLLEQPAILLVLWAYAAFLTAVALTSAASVASVLDARTILLNVLRSKRVGSRSSPDVDAVSEITE